MNTLNNKTKESAWIRLYFNPEKEHFYKDKIIVSAIRRAYRDFNRTLILVDTKDPEKIKDRGLAKNKAEEYLVEALPKLYNTDFVDKNDFDFKHHETCLGLIEAFKMNYGQAQKWVNMSIKYLVLLGEDWVTGIGRNVQFYHPPFDNIVLDEMKKRTTESLKRPWSQWNGEDYFKILNLFRKLYKVRPPLISEFELFNQEGKHE